MASLFPTKVTQEQFNNTAWEACDTFSQVVAPSEYKNHILAFLFIKYLNDKWKERNNQFNGVRVDFAKTEIDSHLSLLVGRKENKLCNQKQEKIIGYFNKLESNCNYEYTQ